MAVIKKLLLSTGGGIISPKQQAEQVENTASIFIGLGGTGIDAIRTIKTEVYSRLKPDDPDAVVPTYKYIRFLGIDTTEKTKGSVEHGETNNSHLALDEDEFLFIGDNKLAEKLKKHDILNMVEELEWFRHEDIKVDFFGKEVPWVRQIGRYLFMNKSLDFANKLSSHIRQAKEDLNGTGLYIHLFAGLSGVTGSGAFLDACYLIKKIAPNATVFGYFFLPDVNLAKISEDNETVRSFIKRNGYASLQELDYCMQLGKNGGEITQLYKGEALGYIDWSGAPVSLCHIIGAEGVGGRDVSNSYDYAMNVTSEYVMDFLTKVNGDNFSLDQHLAICSSMMAHLNFFKTISSEVFYAVLGGACAKIPNKEINTYLASALFSKLTNVKDKRPSDSDVNRIAIEAFAPTKSSINDIYEEILRAVRKDAGNDYTDPPYDWRHLRDFGNSDIVTHYTNQKAAKLYCITKNKESMDSNENTHSLINKLHKVLYDEITDVNKGPNYVYSVMTKRIRFTIENIIDGLIAENKNRYEQELIQSVRIMCEYEEAYQECRSRLGRFFFSNNRLYNEYLFRLVSLMKHEVDIEAYNAMEELLVNLKEKITSSANDYYKKLSNLFNDLLETFELNKITLDSINVQNTNDCFAEELISILEIKDVLDEEVAKLSLDGFMSLLIQHLMKNEKEWLSGEESKIAKLVNDFFVEKVFNNFAEKTIISFLQMKYETTNEEQIKQKVHDEWIKKLATKSSPMFPINSAVTSKLGGSGKFAFVSVPYTSSPIINAAINYKKIDALYGVKSSGLQDRIYIMNCILGIPLCAYLPLEQLEYAQFQSTAYTYGTHYYEGKVYEHNKGKESGFKDWNMLPPVFPIDLITDSRLKRMPNLNKRINEAKELFNKAIECKVLSDKDWYIYDYVGQEKNNIKKLVENSNEILSKLEKPADIVSYNVEDLIKQLDGLSEFKKEKTNMSLPVDGNNSGIKEKRDAIMFDHFFYAPTYMEKVKSILEYEEGILSQIETLRKELKTKKETVLNQAEDIVDFSEAVFSGVISFDGVKMSLERKDDIFEETIILSECREKEVYPYYSIPLYQGFLNYQKLETDDKQSIRKEVNDLLNKTSSQLSEVALKLKEVLTKEKWKQWIDNAANFKNEKEITNVLANIYKYLKKWNNDNYWIFNDKYDF